MVQIELLHIGCTGEELVDKINEIVAAVNSLRNVSSYNDLADLPVVNGVELRGEMSTSDLEIRLADAVDFEEVSDAFATRDYVDTADTQTVEAAVSAAQEVLDSKMDKDLGNITFVTAVGEEAYLPVVTDNGLRKVKVESLANNVAVRNVNIDSLAKAVDDQLTKIELEGEQDGENRNFSPSNPFVAGTSHLFLNGQRLVAGVDYSENGGRSITLLNNAPEASDNLTFIAVKK